LGATGEDAAIPFGPGFFLGQLRAFARDRCPDSAEGLPAVQIHLATGDVLNLCHVVGPGPAFVALAVRSGREEGARMHTELVPYQLIARVSIHAPAGRGHVGFDIGRVPDLLDASLRHLSPESALGRAAGGPPDGTAAVEGARTAVGDARGRLLPCREDAMESDGDAKPKPPP
jgi:hypothetical protein